MCSFEEMYVFSASIDWVLVLGSVVYLIYHYLTCTFDYWKKRNVPFIKPVPLLGNSAGFLQRSRPACLLQQEAYNMFKGERCFGRFNLRTPTLVIRDPNLVQQVLVKDFGHFYNRGFNVDPTLDRLSSHLVNLRDTKWKAMRSRLTPVFSSVKLKSMLPGLMECCEALNQVLLSNARSGNPVNARRLMADFSMDVIGHCAFGLKMNALHDPDSPFRKASKLITRPSIKNRIRFIVRTLFPKLLKWLNWKQFPKDMEDYFIQLIKGTMAARKASNVEAKDFLQLLINLKKEDKITLQSTDETLLDNSNDLQMDDDMMASNAMVFFLAGYDTLASSLGFCLAELARCSSIQERLRQEITDVLAENNDEITVDALKSMDYLDQVISETLRIYPPAGAIPRECTMDWTIPGSDVVITRGSMIQVPVYSLHHDPQYHPEPSSFRPERFAKENRHQIVKGTYLPFGDGPRICIGKRLAELEMKAAICYILTRFNLQLNNRTSFPLKFNPRSIFLTPLGGLWLDVSPLYPDTQTP